MKNAEKMVMFVLYMPGTLSFDALSIRDHM